MSIELLEIIAIGAALIGSVSALTIDEPDPQGPTGRIENVDGSRGHFFPLG